MREVTLLKKGNRFAIYPTTPEARQVVLPALIFKQHVRLAGYAAVMARRQRRSIYTQIEHRCWSVDANGLLVIDFGFMERVIEALTKAGFSVLISEKPRITRAYEADLTQLDDFTCRQDQVELLSHVLSCENGRFDCMTGYGKAQPLDTPTPTPYGWVTFGSLKVGDLVIGRDGFPTQVLGVWPKGNRQVYRVQLQREAHTYCCGDHLWTVRGSKGSSKETIDTHELRARLDAGQEVYVPVAKEWQMPGTKHTNESWRETGTKLAKAYSHKAEPADAPRLLAKMEIYAGDTELDSQLAGSASQRAHMLVAFLRGCKAEAKSGGCIVRRRLINNRDILSLLFLSVGAVLQHSDTTDNQMQVLASRNSTFGKLLLESGLATDLPLKLWQQVASVVPAGSRNCQCITVEAEDGLYVTSGGIVTHNSYVMGVIARLFPYAQIDIVAKDKTVLVDNLFPRIKEILPGVGLMASGVKNIKDRRVMCYTAGMLKHSPATADILLGDEIHQLVTDRLSEQLLRYQRSRNFGFSATMKHRADKLDFRSEQVFGPLRYVKTYEDGQRANMVAPIEVHWTNVWLPGFSMEGIPESRQQEFGIWRNEGRNRLIAKDARSYGPDEQVLINVDRVEHAVQLKRLLPEYTLVYNHNSMPAERRENYVAEGLLAADEPIMSDKYRAELATRFREGTLKKTISTVFKVGIDAPQLQVVVRADGQQSLINTAQVGGRVSRPTFGKEKGIVRDYRDQFWTTAERKAIHRARLYRKLGWKQISQSGVAGLEAVEADFDLFSDFDEEA